MHQTTRLISQMTQSSQYKSVLTLRLSDVGWLLLFNVLAFQIFLQEEFGGMASYIDEIAVLVIAAAAIMFSLNKPKGTKTLAEISKKNASVVLLVLAIVFGIAGNLTSGVCGEAYPILVDVFTFCKGPAVFLCCLSVSCGGLAGNQSAWRLLVVEAKVLIAVMFVCAALNLVSNGTFLDMSNGIRYGMPSFCFVFYHPEVVNLLIVGLLTILLADDQDGHKGSILAALLVMCATLRWKAIGFCALSVYILLLRGRNRLSFLKIITAIAIAALVAWGQVSTYYDTDSTARSMLTSDSLDVALSFAPFGSGFGTFGSAVTADADYYSPLYYRYGYETVYGLSPLTPSYISDTFWPTVIAQLGFVGALCYTLSLVVIILGVYRRGKKMEMGLAIAIPIFYLAISSTSASALFAPQWVFILYVLFLSYVLRRKSPSLGLLPKRKMATKGKMEDRNELHCFI